MPTDERYDPAFQRGYEAPPPPELVPRRENSASGESYDSRHPETSPANEAISPATPARNPWLAVLWVLAVVFILAGIAVLAVVPGAETPFDVFVLPVLQAVAPWLVAAGLAALVAAVTLHAVRAEQR